MPGGGGVRLRFRVLRVIHTNCVNGGAFIRDLSVLHGKWWVIILRVRVVHSNAVNMGELIRVIRVVHSIVTVCVGARLLGLLE